MSIEVYSDVILACDMISASLRGRNMRLNRRTQNGGGWATANRGWSKTLRMYEMGYKPMLIEDWETLIGLHEVTEGGVFGFLMEDPLDSQIDVGEGKLWPVLNGVQIGTAGNGYGVPIVRAYKRYTALATSRTKDRLITRLGGDVVLKRGAATVVVGVAAGNVSQNLQTGTYTFVPDVTKAITGRTVGATTQIVVATPFPGISVGGRMYISGMTGADAALLNDQSHAVTVITGAGPTTYTLSVNTAGKAINVSGNAYQYPQPTETLTLSGSFYVPVQFKGDDLEWELVRAGDDDTRLFAGPSVALLEIREQ